MEKITRPDEILIRFQVDGTAAAHVVKIEDFYDDGQIITSKTLLPEPLSLAGPEFDALIPAIDQAILASNAALHLQIRTLVAEREATEAEMAQLRSDLEKLQSGRADD